MDKNHFKSELKEITNIEHGFKPMEHLAKQMINRGVQLNDAYELYKNTYYQIRMVSVYLLGHYMNSDSVLYFLKATVAKDNSWQVQEVLAKIFDNYCNNIGYENCLPLIQDWLSSSNENTRRAVSEGLRIWTTRPYFKEHPEIAIAFLIQLKTDKSEYVRKSCGNALRDISKKYPDLIINEINKFGDTFEEQQIKKIILKNKRLAVLIKR